MTPGTWFKGEYVKGMRRVCMKCHGAGMVEETKHEHKDR